MSSPQATSRPRIPRRGADHGPAVPRMDEPLPRPRRTQVLSVSSHVLPFDPPATGTTGALDGPAAVPGAGCRPSPTPAPASTHQPEPTHRHSPAPAPGAAHTVTPPQQPRPARGTIRRRTALLVAVPVVVALGLAAVALLSHEDRTPLASQGAGGGQAAADGGAAASSAATGLDPDLEARFAAAVEGAAADGVPLTLTSGWRSAEDQAALVESALATHGSTQEAHRWVLPPERSAHVSGLAVDVGPTDGALWLESNGAGYGLCRVYANEVWHFEPVIEPGGTCPDLLPDSSSGWDGIDS